MKKIIILISSLIILSSCATQRFSVSDKPMEVSHRKPSFSRWGHFFIHGIFQTSYSDVGSVCKRNGGVEAVETKLTFAQGLILVFTHGLYTPRQENIYCKR